MSYSFYATVIQSNKKFHRVVAKNSNGHSDDENDSKNGKSKDKMMLDEEPLRYESRLFWSPIESYLLTFICIIAMIGEYLTARINGKFVLYANTQHISMYFFSWIPGLMHCLNHLYKIQFPPGILYETWSLGFFVTSMLFYFHSHGRSHLEIHVHQLVTLAYFSTCAASLIEMMNPRDIMACIFKNYTLCIAGSWMIQVAFILYDPWPSSDPWDGTNHDHLMMITTLFTVHMAAWLTFFMLWAAVIMNRKSSLRESEERIKFAQIPYEIIYETTDDTPSTSSSTGIKSSMR